MGESDGPTVRAFRAGVATANGVDEGIRGCRAAGVLKRRPGPARIDAGMVIGAADSRLEPGIGSFRGDAVFDGKPLDDPRSQRYQESGSQVIQCFGSSAILYLERVAQQH